MVQRTYTYSPTIIRKAIWESIWLTRGGMLIGIVLLMLIVFLIEIGNQALMWLSGFIAGFAITYFLLLIRSYLYGSRRLKAYNGIQIQLGFDENGITINSAIISSTFPWSSLLRLQITRSFLFLTLVGSTQPVLVPKNIFSADDIKFIRNQFAKKSKP